MIDIASIVPSARDFLQAIATRRKRLVLVPLVDRADDAQMLAAAGVSAFAVAAPGDAMRAVSTAVGANPILSLAPVASADQVLLARSGGADAVVLAAASEPSEWNATAQNVFSVRMAALATVVDATSAAFACTTKARGIYLCPDAVGSVAAIAAKMSSMRIVVHLPSMDETGLRALRGVVDAVIVDSDLYLSTSFDTLREELDP